MSCQLILMKNGMWGAKSKKTRYFRDPQGSIIGSGEHEESYLNKPLEQVAEFLVQRGIDPDDIDDAIVCMMKNEHNVAEFGVLGGFVFSKFVGVLH